ncbi:MAG: single-stranded-DNA-specific exonuclease RecJ [Kiritimatiellae bacterium]|jgi:single-stranded-DNA-specific exonuclease|nr:single-stranded-DNA-specific exonuclease RecJ [Kiritimatiellia bacterium]MDD4117499.1 single-stranded-DNA-specific exonuclease RecJ [Kiritimatiellia bacterium]NCC91983.1 single-stranded-DNA-specific exonuclease RecJ [Opitutae bacterium]
MLVRSEKRWVTAEADPRVAEDIARTHGFSRAMARALVTRGLVDHAEIEKFLQPRLADLTDPFSLPGMQTAVDLILSHIEQGSAILVYGDYDVDGVTATALMIQVLSGLGAVAVPFLPHRIEDGYGLGVETLHRCIENYHPNLIITVDCGTSSVEAVREAARLGIDVIVTDHHEPAAEGVAEACAIVNPKLGGGPEDIRMLAGVGVAFKVCHGLVKAARQRRMEAAEKLDLKTFMELVAVGTVADIVPLLKENRILVYHGLTLLNRTQSVGLRTLIEAAGISGYVDTYHIGFIIGPRINAAGRLGNAEAALELVLTEQEPRARILAQQLDDASRKRQEIEDKIVQEACSDLDGRFDAGRDFGLVVAHPHWHAGVIGIVASRIASRYNRPVVVIGMDDDGVGRGSCRSVPGFDLLKHLQQCSPMLRRYGGHAMAAGLEVDHSRIEEFAARFNEVCAATLSRVDQRRQLLVDAWITPGDIGDPLYHDQNRLRPFGHSNPLPVWAIRNVTPLFPPRVIGGKHLKILFSMGGRQREAIGFGMGDREVPDGPLDIAFNLILNRYNGQEYLQLHLQDLRPTQHAD